MYRPQRAFRWSDWSTVDRIAVVSLLAAAIIEIVSLIVLPVEGYDAQYHLFWIQAWHKLWQSGVLYPRWLPDSFHGFGAPTFYYYPPLTYVLTSVLYLLLPAASLQCIVKLFLILTLCASGVAMWYYLRSRIGSMAAVTFGVAVYMFAPYRFLDFNTRATFTEHFAFVFIPLILLQAEHLLAGRNTARSFTLLVISLAGLTLTSVPSTIAVFLGLAVYALVPGHSSTGRNLAWLSMTAISTILLCAFYLLLIPLHLADIQYSKALDASIGPGSPIVTLLQGGAVRIGIYTTLTYLGACFLLYKWWNARRLRDTTWEIRYDHWLLVLIVALELPWIPYPLFRYVPPFTIMQQSYRLSMLLIFVVARSWPKHLSGDFQYKGVSGVIAIWSLGTVLLVGAQLLGVQVHPHADLRSFEPHEFPARWMLQTEDPEAALSVGFHNQFGPMFRPRDSGISILIFTHSAYSDSVVYQSDRASILILHRAYWPAWDARIDGQTVTTWPDSVGRLTLRVPSGQHTVATRFDETTHERVGMWISIATLIALFLFAFFYPTRKLTPTDP